MTTIVNKVPSGLIWKLKELPYPLNFKVYSSIQDGVHYFRPHCAIHRCEFEDFFHFSSHCEDYTSTRVVVKDPKKKGTLLLQGL